ncbi:MAG: peptide-methionine (S)-S-oxide reductase MsrA [Rhodospirillales bacterium]|jgi:peptide-methionine (S)-S-oxide reductase|nr:peptide-methionine (S)-S-oxide reductase MsrA [Rhodospirillales bacterium]
MKQATFAAGCFWGVEHAFRQVNGVTDVAVGYTGGTTPDPNYKDVCSSDTGHAEAALVSFDPDVISYEELLDVFWSVHDPSQLNRQGPDVGSQYRSAVFVHDEEQEKAALASKQRLEDKGLKIVTEITKADTFGRAEEYHQRYIEKNRR